jgi:hypothetical protein
VRRPLQRIVFNGQFADGGREFSAFSRLTFADGCFLVDGSRVFSHFEEIAHFLISSFWEI